jgi:ABC-2 type transport system ATP-binding protein
MISIRDFHFSYGKTPVFSGVSTTLTPGHIYGILGKNGTGKSTLLYNIAGLLYPKQGRITVNGEDPSKRSPQFLEDIFMVPEEFYLPNISIRSFVKYYSPFYPKFDHEDFARHLASFDIRPGSNLQGMSYGQRKKVYISFGIASNASVLLMDEPTNGLDIISKTQLRKVMAGAATPDKTILISSHQVKDLENLIDEILILDGTAIALKQSLNHIAKKLTFRISLDDDDLREALYAESVLKGNTIVARNKDNEESHVDLELLYKATMADPARMNSILTSN